MKYAFWIFSNIYGYLTGYRFLAPFHHVGVNLALHGLGYDNGHHLSSTGEKWFIKRVLAPAGISTAIDVGANVGNYSALLVSNTESIVYSIEPLSSSFKLLEKKAGERIKPFKLALSNYVGNGTLFSKGEAWEGASLSQERLENPSICEEVEVSTLDDFIKKQKIVPDFIKIDTEGYEYEVLSGLQETIKLAPPRFIQFEFNLMHLQRGFTLLSIAELLPGYDFYRLLPHGMLMIDPKKYINNIFMFSNIVAIRNDL